jgi:hypothetical protein
MPTPVINHVPGMISNVGKSLHAFGKDSTGQIEYKFNQQGFRSLEDFDWVPAYAFFGCSLVFGIGVDQRDVFSSSFPGSQNYGLAGKYDNHDIMLVLDNFLKSDLCNDNTHMAVFWHQRDGLDLSDFYDQLQNYQILHFFCGTPLDRPRCYSVPKQLDSDVSQTHPGPKTHKTISKILCALFDQS